MKLKDVIQYLDRGSYVIIWEKFIGYDDEEKVFEGFIADIPWIYLDCDLSPSNAEGEAISARKYDDKNQWNSCGFIISLMEPLPEDE